MDKRRGVSRMHECSRCGVELNEDEDYERPDPFLSEVYDKIVVDYWCDNCYAERHLEI
jgi:hypothetical protein